MYCYIQPNVQLRNVNFLRFIRITPGDTASRCAALHPDCAEPNWPFPTSITARSLKAQTYFALVVHYYHHLFESPRAITSNQNKGAKKPNTLLPLQQHVDSHWRRGGRLCKHTTSTTLSLSSSLYRQGTQSLSCWSWARAGLCNSPTLSQQEPFGRWR